VPERVQGEVVKPPAPSLEKLTVPLGVVGLDEVSLTVAVQVVDAPTITLFGTQFRLVVTRIGFADMSAKPELVE
jgi:hypothetical protein